MPDQQQPLSTSAAFFATLWGKVLATLAAITMIVGIYVEVIAAWRGTNEAIKAAADAAVAKQLAVAQTEKLSEEARVAKELNDAQTQKLKAEAGVAKEINEVQLRKIKAEECSARAKAIFEVQPPEKVSAAFAALQRDCPALDEKSDDEATKREMIKLADHLNFYRLMASNCNWTQTPNFDVVDRFIAQVKPSEYAEGRASAQKSVSDLTTIAQGNFRQACPALRSVFDRFANEVDTLRQGFKDKGFIE